MSFWHQIQADLHGSWFPLLSASVHILAEQLRIAGGSESRWTWRGICFEVWLKGFSGWISITNRAGARVLPAVTHTHFLFPLPHRFTTLSFSHWWKFSHGDLSQEVNHVIYTWKSNFTFWDLILINREVNLGVLFCNHCKLFCLVLHLSYSLPELYSSFCSSWNCLLFCGAYLSSF